MRSLLSDSVKTTALLELWEGCGVTGWTVLSRHTVSVAHHSTITRATHSTQSDPILCSVLHTIQDPAPTFASPH